jgi:hypothetical protein
MFQGKVVEISKTSFKIQTNDQVQRFNSDNTRNLILYSNIMFTETNCIVTSLENIKGEILRHLVDTFCRKKKIKNKDRLYNGLIQSANWKTSSKLDSVIEMTLYELNEYNSCTSIIKNNTMREALRNNIFKFLFKNICTSFCSLIGIPFVRKPKRFVKIFNSVTNPMYRIKYINTDCLDKLMKIYKYTFPKKELNQRRHACFILNDLILKPGHLCLPLSKVPFSIHFDNRDDMFEKLKKFSFTIIHDHLIENGVLKKQTFINNLLSESKLSNQSQESNSRELVVYDEKNEATPIQEEKVISYIEEFEIISGAAGSGKTTEMVSLLSDAKLVYFVLAPTGKAVQRVVELLHQKGIKFEDNRVLTIHRFLFGQIPESIDLLIIDEASMISLKLFYKLFRKLHTIRSSVSKLIMVGDPNQLDPIERGCIFSELINSNQFNHRILSKNYRADAGLSIAINQIKLLKNETDFITDDNFVIERTTNIDRLIDLITQFILDSKEEVHELFEDLQIITPFKESAENINRRIKTILFSDDSNRFHINERVICKKNLYGGKKKKSKKESDSDSETDDYNEDDFIDTNDIEEDLKRKKKKDHGTVMNGEQGVIIDIFPHHKLPGEMNYKIKFPPDREIIFSSDEFDPKPMKHIQPSYALTIHASQGSEWKYVIIFIPDRAAGNFIVKNMIYTAMSRATHYVRIFCENIELYSIKKKSQKYSLMNQFLTCD